MARIVFDEQGQGQEAETVREESKPVVDDEERKSKRRKLGEKLYSKAINQEAKEAQEPKESGEAEEPKEPEETKETRAKTRAINYLHTFGTNEWKFQKTRQIWLLRHLYYPTEVSSDDFKLILNYMKKMSESAKKTTLQEAQDFIDKLKQKEKDSVEIVIFKRAKKVCKSLNKEV